MTIRLKSLLFSSGLALIASVAHADENRSFLDQEGDGNQALITQVGSSNKAGGSEGSPSDVAGLRILQDGNNNSLTIEQTGVSFAGTRGAGIDQIGNRNVLSILDQGSNDRVNQVQQTANVANATATTNSAQIDQDANSSVRRINQIYTGDGITVDQRNLVTITQNGSWNAVGTGGVDSTGGGILQDGHSNTAAVTQRRGRLGLLDQEGLSNSATIIQDGGTGGTQPEIVTVQQTGNDNIVNLTQTGVGNLVSLLQQWEDSNLATITQTGSTNVVTTVDQDGGDNVLTLVQNGNGNQVLRVEQDGGSNTANLDFQGNDNGATAFSGGFASLGLTQGEIIQDNTGSGTNLIDFTVYGNGNLFAFKQAGTGNVISGMIGSAGISASSNQVAVLQVGDSNIASFVQAGSGNALSVSQ